MDALEASGYLHRARRPTREKTRRLVRRLNLESHDAKVWLGMLRQIRWKQRSGDEQKEQKNKDKE